MKMSQAGDGKAISFGLKSGAKAAKAAAAFGPGSDDEDEPEAQHDPKRQKSFPGLACRLLILNMS